MTTLRHGLREEQFRRYEPLIAQAVANWPRQSRFKPELPVRSVETLRARLRDAMLSFNQNRWQSNISYQAFSTMFEASQVAIDNNEVVICARGMKPIDQPGQVVAAKGLIVGSDDPAVISAIILLHHNGILLAPTQLSTSVEVETLVGSFDITLTNTGPNLYTIL